jgi:hypothetical protein
METIFGQDVRAALDQERAEQCAASRKYAGCFESESLCRWQADVHYRGFRGAHLVESKYGWSVRSDSGMENFMLLASSRAGDLDGSRQDAEKWAREWQEQDAMRRYVWA